MTLIGRDEQAMAECERIRENARYFPGMKLPDNMHFTADAPTALTGADIVVLALPAQVLRSQLQSFARYIEPNAMLVSLAKGLETGTGLRMSQVITEELEESMALRGADVRAIGHIPHRVCVLSGPNLAKEIMGEEPTASVVRLVPGRWLSLLLTRLRVRTSARTPTRMWWVPKLAVW